MKNILLTVLVFGIVGCASLSFETSGNTANGYGEIRFKNDGDYYKGYYKNSIRHGPGEQFIPLDCWACVGFDKGLSIGWFENNKFMGEIQDFKLNGITDGIGQFKFPDGSTYKGNWKNEQFHGEGLYLNPAGRWYLGTFENGKVRGVSYLDGEIVIRDINSIVLNIGANEQKAIDESRKEAERERLKRQQQFYAAKKAKTKNLYLSDSKFTKDLNSANASDKNNSSGNCSQSRAELGSALARLKQAKNFYYVNSIKCNTSSSCPTPMAKQCRNAAAMCRNNSSSCQVGNYSCINRASSNYQSCRFNANQQYNQCQQQAKKAAENQRKNCLLRVKSVKNQCLSNTRSKASSLISQASSGVSGAEIAVSKSCNE